MAGSDATTDVEPSTAGAAADARRAVSHAHGVRTALRAGARAMRRHPGLAALLLGATLAQGVLQGLLVWALRDVLLWFSRTSGAGTALAWGALIILGLWSARVLSTFLGEIVSARLAHRVEIDTMQQVLAKLLTLSVRYFERSSQGDLVMAAYHDLKGIRTVTLELGTIALALSRLVGLVVVAWFLSPLLAVIGLVVVPLGAIPAHRLGQHITNAARFERDTSATLFDSFLQVASGIRVIKVNRAEDRVLERARTVGHDLYRHIVRQAQARSIARVLIESASGVGLVVVLVVGGRAVAAGDLEWQALLSLLIAVMAVYGPIISIMTVYNAIRAVIPNLDRGEEIMRTQPEVRDAPDAVPLRRAPAVIELENVSFAYDDRLVLDGVSATFHAGETIGIVGPSGSGKSTLLALLLRLYDPTSGRIRLDGTDLRAVRHADLMDLCAIVPQEPFLFVDTIANNIRFTRPDAPLSDVVAAAKAANVHDEITLTEHGYDTMLGRHRAGRSLSGGQKQRVCIAAAILKNAPMLFLDEATSSLDSVSERAVQAAIDRLMAGRTAFVIAHRLSTLRAADRILVLDQGRCVGLGTHEELLATCETYQGLWRYQATGAMPEELATPQGRDTTLQPS